jgi:hypothetical protein
MYTGLWWGNLRERDRLSDRNVDGRIILSWIFRRGMDWIELAQDMDRLRALVNVVMNLRVLQSAGNLLTSRKRASF